MIFEPISDREPRPPRSGRERARLQHGRLLQGGSGPLQAVQVKDYSNLNLAPIISCKLLARRNFDNKLYYFFPGYANNISYSLIIIAIHCSLNTTESQKKFACRNFYRKAIFREFSARDSNLNILQPLRDRVLLDRHLGHDGGHSVRRGRRRAARDARPVAARFRNHRRRAGERGYRNLATTPQYATPP